MGQRWHLLAAHRLGRSVCRFARNLPLPDRLEEWFCEGQVAVATCMRPNAFSIAFGAKTFPSARPCKRETTRSHVSPLPSAQKSLWGLITNSNQVLISESIVFSARSKDPAEIIHRDKAPVYPPGRCSAAIQGGALPSSPNKVGCFQQSAVCHLMLPTRLKYLDPSVGLGYVSFQQ